METYEFMHVFGLAEKDDVVCSKFQVNDVTWSIRGQKRLHGDTRYRNTIFLLQFLVVQPVMFLW